MKKIHRFITPVRIQGEILFLENEEVIHQIKNVLKIKVGEEITVCDGQGKQWTVEVQGISKTEFQGEIREQYSGSEPLQNEVTLFLSILKNENFELAAQKAVECGVSHIVPITSRRTIKQDIKFERLQRIVREAAEQSGRMALPSLSEPISFTQALDQSKRFQQAFFFDLEGQPLTLHATRSTLQTPIALFIGPEGGWESEELEQAKAAKLHISNLGMIVLRAETAAAVTSFLFAHGIY